MNKNLNLNYENIFGFIGQPVIGCGLNNLQS